MRDFNIELVLIYEGLARSFHELICLNKVDIPNRSRACQVFEISSISFITVADREGGCLILFGYNFFNVSKVRWRWAYTNNQHHVEGSLAG